MSDREEAVSEWQPAIIAPYLCETTEEYEEFKRKFAGRRIRVMPFDGPTTIKCGGKAYLVHPDDVAETAVEYRGPSDCRVLCEHEILTD